MSATSAPLRLESKKLVGLKISGTMESNVALVPLGNSRSTVPQPKLRE